MAFFTLNAFCVDYESNLYQGYLETSGKSFYNSDYIFFSGGWDSTNDTIQTPSLYLDNDASQSASQKFYNITGISFIGVEDFYVEDGASASIALEVADDTLLLVLAGVGAVLILIILLCVLNNRLC